MLTILDFLKSSHKKSSTYQTLQIRRLRRGVENPKIAIGVIDDNEDVFHKEESSLLDNEIENQQ
jgi:hypothetical protein